MRAWIYVWYCMPQEYIAELVPRLRLEPELASFLRAIKVVGLQGEEFLGFKPQFQEGADTGPDSEWYPADLWMEFELPAEDGVRKVRLSVYHEHWTKHSQRVDHVRVYVHDAGESVPFPT